MPVDGKFLDDLIAQAEKRGLKIGVETKNSTAPMIGILKRSSAHANVYTLTVGTCVVTNAPIYCSLLDYQVENAWLQGDGFLQTEPIKRAFSDDNSRESTYELCAFLVQLVQVTVPQMVAQGLIQDGDVNQVFTSSQLMLADIMKQAKPIRFGMEFNGVVYVPNMVAADALNNPGSSGDGNGKPN